MTYQCTLRLYELRRLIEAWAGERARFALATSGTTVTGSWASCRTPGSPERPGAPWSPASVVHIPAASMPAILDQPNVRVPVTPPAWR
jgi:hypothetical protein